MSDLEEQKDPVFTALGRTTQANHGEAAELKRIERDLGITDTDGVPSDEEQKEDDALKQAFAQEIEDATKTREAVEEISSKDKGSIAKTAFDLTTAVIPGMPDSENSKKLQQQALASVSDSAQEIANFGLEIADGVESYLRKQGLTTSDVIDSEDEFTFSDRIFPDPDAADQQVVRSVTKYLLPFAASVKLAKKGSKLAKFAKVSGATAAFDFAAIDPDEGRLSDLIQTNPDLMNPVSAMLANSEEDSNFDRRAKNAMEGILFDVGLAGTFWTAVKGARSVRKLTSSKKVAEAPVVKGKAEEPVREVDPKDQEIINRTKIEFIEMQLDKLDKAKTSDEFLDGINVNLHANTDDESVIKMVRSVATRYPEQLKKWRRDTKSFEEIVEGGLEGATDKGTIRKIVGMQPGDILNAEETVALQFVWEAYGKQLQKFVLNAPEALDAKQAGEFVQLFHNFTLFNNRFFGNAAEQGRALVARKAMVSMKMGDKLKIQAMINNAELEGGVDDINRMLLYMKDIANTPSGDFLLRMNSVSKKNMAQKTFDVILKARQNNLISSPQTFAVNIVGSTVTGFSSIAERGLSRIWSSSAREIAEKQAKASGKSVSDLPVADQPVVAGEATAMVRAGVSESARQAANVAGGIRDMIKMAAHEVRKGQPIQTAKKVLEGTVIANQRGIIRKKPFQTALEAQDLGATDLAGSYGFQGFWKDLGNVMGFMISSPSRGLVRLEESLAMIHYRTEANALSLRQATNEGLDGLKLQKRVKDLAENPPEDIALATVTKNAKKIRASAQQFAEKNIFTSDLEGMAQTAQDLITKTGVDTFGVAPLRILFPFSRVDLNILTYAFDRTPFAMLGSKYKADIAAGGARAQMAQSKVALGSSVLGLSGILGYNGVMTGSGPRNPNAKKLLRQTGWQENSIKIGNTYYRYDRVSEPFTRVMNLGANLGAISGYMVDEGKAAELDKIIAMSSMMVAESMSPTFLVEDTGNLVELLEGDERKSQKIMSQIISTTAVPFSSALRTMRKQVDPVVRDRRPTREDGLEFVQQLVNDIMNIIPGLSDNLPPTRNLWGEEIVYPPGFGPDIISPIAAMEEDKSPVFKEMIRLGVSGPLENPLPPAGETHLQVKMPSNIVNKSMSGLRFKVEMTPQEYDRYVQLAAGNGLERRFHPFRGKSLKEVLNKEITQDYPSIKRKKNKTDQFRRVRINEIISLYRQGALMQMQMLDESFADKFNQKRNNALEAVGERPLRSR